MDFFDVRQVPEDGYQISYTSPTGELHILHSIDRAANKARRVALRRGGFGGGEAKASFTERESVTQFGVRRSGFKLPPFGGSLSVQVRAEPGRLAFTRRNFVQAWSQFDEGVLKVTARDGGNRWCRVVGAVSEGPEHETAGRRSQELTVDWTCLHGAWFGASRRYQGAGVEVVAPGGVRPTCRIVWDVEANPEASVTFPSGQVLNLKASSVFDEIPGRTPTGIRYINLDRGMAGQVTREDGSVDDRTWSSLRGMALGVSLHPHEKTTWTLTGCELEVTPRYLTPWG